MKVLDVSTCVRFCVRKWDIAHWIGHEQLSDWWLKHSSRLTLEKTALFYGCVLNHDFLQLNGHFVVEFFLFAWVHLVFLVCHEILCGYFAPPIFSSSRKDYSVCVSHATIYVDTFPSPQQSTGWIIVIRIIAMSFLCTLSPLPSYPQRTFALLVHTLIFGL